jgi:two-component system, NarL family, response regulator LiaR
VTIRLVLADDHVVLRQGLRALLEDESDLEVVGEADNGREAVDVVLQTEPDVVLIDLVMPETDGVAATRIIHERSPKTRVLVLSSFEEEPALVASVRAGAIGFLRKTAPIGAVVRAIRAAARGEVQFSPTAAALLVRGMQQPSEAEHLTPRELEVLQLIAEGLANKEIAWKLGITEKTVKSHVSAILGKLGLQSRTQAAMDASRLGLLRTEPPRFVPPVHARNTRVVSLDSVRRPKAPVHVRHA